MVACCAHFKYYKKLLFSTDTDVLYIGLLLVNHYVYDMYVQLSHITSPEMRVLQLDLAGDPDPALYPTRPKGMCSADTVYMQWVSFFAGFGKATIIRHFLRMPG